MTKLIVLLIVSIGLQVADGDLDAALNSFLASTKTRGSAGASAEAVKNLFNLYTKEFNQNLKTASEQKVRLTAFNDTINVIIDHYRQREKTYTLGLNIYSDWTKDESSKLRGVQVPQGGIKATNAKPGDRFLTWDGKSSQSRSTLPTSYDLTTRVAAGTNVPVVLPIKNQYSCGSCYAFAFIALLEFQYAVQLKSSDSLSEQQMVDCSKNDNGCLGGYFTQTFSYLKSNLWQVDGELSYPYKAVSGKCVFKGAGGGGVRFGSLLYNMTAVNNANAMEQALVNYGPLWVSLFVGDSTTPAHSSISTLFQSYKTGIFQPGGCPTSLGTTNHAVVIVGYGNDASTNSPYWKVRNSWGTGWGESGYFRIPRGVNMCGIESGVFYIAKPV